MRVCLTGRFAYPNGALYPRADLRVYLQKLNIAVIDKMSSREDLLVTSMMTLNTRKMQDAHRLGATIVEWPKFAEWAQVAGFFWPPDLHYWEAPDGTLWCEIDDGFEPDLPRDFFPTSGNGRKRIRAVPVSEPRWFGGGYGPLAGRLVAMHQQIDGET